MDGGDLWMPLLYGSLVCEGTSQASRRALREGYCENRERPNGGQWSIKVGIFIALGCGFNWTGDRDRRLWVVAWNQRSLKSPDVSLKCRLGLAFKLLTQVNAYLSADGERKKVKPDRVTPKQYLWCD